MDKYIKSIKQTISRAINTSNTLKAFSNQLSNHSIIVSRPFKTTMMHLNLKYYKKPNQDKSSNLKLTPNSIKRIIPFLSKKMRDGINKHQGQYIRLNTKGLAYYDTKHKNIINSTKLGHKFTEKAILKQIKHNAKRKH